MAHLPTWLLFASLASFWYAVDQVSKQLAVTHLTGRPDVSVIGDVLQLHLTRNPGAAFSLGPDFTIGISILALVASLVVLWLSRQLEDRVWAIALGFLLAGILGNFTDRLLQDPGPFRGEVIDFLMLPNWPVFNVADICINIGVGLVLLQSLRAIGLDGQKQQDDDGAVVDEGE
ncbi:signal peptidase II [Nocardioides panacisoli]|uniref:signal peptidase II n=1 Tax=Nocardioides panacisoli TaxID=627624 RepID=UPI001C636718|nr:signal peptidase II [Nocardioides panacisoli]QYJ04752.1 signal peptidase II [Nocardioides panacisoli]